MSELPVIQFDYTPWLDRKASWMKGFLLVVMTGLVVEILSL